MIPRQQQTVSVGWSLPIYFQLISKTKLPQAHLVLVCDTTLLLVELLGHVETLLYVVVVVVLFQAERPQ